MTWLSESAKRTIATKSLGEQHLLLEEKVKAAFKATSVFMAIYHNMEDYLIKQEGENLVSFTKPSIPVFKELLSSREHQKHIKRILVAQTDFTNLTELNKELPLFNLGKDLLYLQCKNRMKNEDKPLDELNIL